MSMPTILFFHHVQGLTPGALAFADALRAAVHALHTPDLLEGHQFASIPDGLAYLQRQGFGTVIARGTEAAGARPQADVVIGMSLGVMPAQYLVQTREGVRGAVFLHGAVSVREFSPA